MTRLGALALAAALSLAASPMLAQPAPPAPAPVEQPAHSRAMPGEVIAYLALPALAVLVFLVGLAVGGGDEDQPASA